jgi:iron complex transport system ATP-binding protein
MDERGAAITTRALCVARDGRDVLHGLTMLARFGEVLAIVGPNGAGKSTLLRTLAGLLAYRGTIAIEGAELSTLSSEQRARRVSFVPQQSQLTAALAVREVVALGRYVHRPALSRLRETDARAVDDALRHTDVLALAERAFSALSTGEQKRVLLARALCTGARILLLDEPTASLDIEHALRLFALLRALAASGHAVLVVLHQLEHALAFADRALLLQHGALLACGPAREVLTPAHVRSLHHVVMLPGAAPGFALPDEPP